LSLPNLPSSIMSCEAALSYYASSGFSITGLCSDTLYNCPKLNSLNYCSYDTSINGGPDQSVSIYCPSSCGTCSGSSSRYI